ncbi:MAG: lysophospholipid acyltransferase family protein [Tepidisphaeraceae bacterium]|jgi:1-acyl-sn-glycerol-3-phosphate acyltransferase
MWKLAQTFCRIVTTCAFDLKVYGEENVPERGGVLLVANHQSYLDPVLIGVRLPRQLSYMAKSELFENPRAARLLRWLHSFPVHQGTADVGAVRETIVRLRSGRALAIFPEGSRTSDGQMLPMQRGVALVIRRAKVPVIPVAIFGAYEAWPITEPMFRPAHIRVWYGKPMELAQLPEPEILRIIDRSLRGMFRTLKTSETPPGDRITAQ